MTRKLVLDRDACGSHGQLSLLADYFEWCAWLRPLELTHKVLADYFVDRRIRIARPPAQVLLDPDADTAEDEPLPAEHVTREDVIRRHANEDASAVLAMCAERARYLGPTYPYRADTKRLQRRLGNTVAYDVALSLLLRHTCLSDANAALEFETFVSACLGAQPYKVFALSSEVRASPGSGVARFREVHKRMTIALELAKDPTARVSAQIHDGGSDVLARWPPIDDRPGCRTLLVQVTVAEPKRWSGKMNQSTQRWKRLLGDPVEPLVTLAVPHHVEREQLHALVEEGRGATIMDRVRLVAHRPAVSPPQRTRVAALKARGVEW